MKIPDVVFSEKKKHKIIKKNSKKKLNLVLWKNCSHTFFIWKVIIIMTSVFLQNTTSHNFLKIVSNNNHSA